jgi:integrase
VIEDRAAGISHESRRQWLASMAHVKPIIGHLPPSAIDTPLVLRCIEPIWASKQVTADRIRQRIETVLNWATARGYRSGVNPARWQGHLQHVLQASHSVEHRPALPYRVLPAFMTTLRDHGGMSARALEFTILTACRTGEVLGARWAEIEGDIWTVPATRTKARKAHTVPLAPA